MLLRGTRHSSCIRPRMEIGGGAHGRARVFAKKERELRIYTYIYIFAYHEENMPRNAPRALKRGWPERGEPTTRGEEEGKEEAEADARVQKKKQLHPVHPTISLSFSLSLSFSHCVVDSCVPILRVYIPLSATNLFAAPFRHKETIRVTKYLDPCTLREGRDFLIARTTAWNLEFWMRVLWDSTREILTRIELEKIIEK